MIVSIASLLCLSAAFTDASSRTAATSNGQRANSLQPKGPIVLNNSSATINVICSREPGITANPSINGMSQVPAQANLPIMPVDVGQKRAVGRTGSKRKVKRVQPVKSVLNSSNSSGGTGKRSSHPDAAKGANAPKSASAAKTPPASNRPVPSSLSSSSSSSIDVPVSLLGAVNETKVFLDSFGGMINKVLKSRQESKAYKAKLQREVSDMEQRYTNLQKILDYNVDKNEKLAAELEKSNKQLSKALSGYMKRTEQVEKLTRELRRYKKPEASADSGSSSSE